MNRAEFQRLTGRTKAAVNRLLEASMPHVTVGTGRTAEVRIDLATAVLWLVARVLEPPDAGPDVNTARARLAIAQEEVARMKLARDRGELVDRETTRRAVFARARAERDAHRTWVARTAPLLAAELGVDGHKLFTVLDATMADHLRRLADTPLDYNHKDQMYFKDRSLV